MYKCKQHKVIRPLYTLTGKTITGGKHQAILSQDSPSVGFCKRSRHMTTLRVPSRTYPFPSGIFV